MNTKNEPDEQHVPITTLWDYRMNKRPLLPQERFHISGCNDCLSRFGLCQLSQSFEEVQRRLKEAELL
jgi:hypothetical protein